MENNEKNLVQYIEAALFMSSEAISMHELSRLVKSSLEETRIALNKLSSELDERNSALEIRDEPNGVKLGIRKQFENVMQHFSTVPELSSTVLKTLAFISYKQPVRQSEVIRFRNNKAYEHIATLEEKGFIRIESVGRTFIIFTTKKFVDYFGEPKKPLNLEKKI